MSAETPATAENTSTPTTSAQANDDNVDLSWLFKKKTTDVLSVPKVEVDDEKKVYCVCRTSRVSNFMIGCDGCGEWFHGDCIGVKKKDADHIEKFFCERCRSANPSLQIVYTPRKAKSGSPSPPVRCGNCIACYRPDDCKRCEACLRADGSTCMKRICVQAEVLGKTKKKEQKRKREAHSSVDEDEGEVVSTVAVKGKRGRKKGWRKENQASTPFPSLFKKKDGERGARTSDVKAEVKEEPEGRDEKLLRRYFEEMNTGHSVPYFDSGFNYLLSMKAKRRRAPTKAASPVARQCEGPNCIHEARMDSQYCSDECGELRAQEIILAELPQKVAAYWERNPVAEDQRQEMMVKLHEETQRTVKKYDVFLDRFKSVVRWIEAVKNMEPSEEHSDSVETEYVLHCPVCTFEVPSKQWAKHVERCFVRTEKQISFGTTQPQAVLPNDLFCDVQNKVNKTYCKRLRVMCAEHYKGEYESEMKVCGYPKAWAKESGLLPDELFMEPDELMKSGFCQLSSKACQVHHRWVQATLAAIDSERYNLLTHISELNEKMEWLNRLGITRADLFSLLTCDTIPATTSS